MKKKGYIQVYTGNGKGKTTAALGLAIRAAGAGGRVFFGQFCKGKRCSEHRILSRVALDIVVKQFGCTCFFKTPAEKDFQLAKKGFILAQKAMTSGKYDLIILDELNVALHHGLIELKEVLALCDNKPVHVELIITGRDAPKELVKRADLVTEMREIKHYWKKGVVSRKGIEE